MAALKSSEMLYCRNGRLFIAVTAQPTLLPPPTESIKSSFVLFHFIPHGQPIHP